jgi:hypothetical protein
MTLLTYRSHQKHLWRAWLHIFWIQLLTKVIIQQEKIEDTTGGTNTGLSGLIQEVKNSTRYHLISINSSHLFRRKQSSRFNISSRG